MGHPQDEAAAGEVVEARRRAAAEQAVACVEDGMVLGYGTGRAAGHALEALARRVAGGLRIRGVPSSRATEAKARALGLPLATLDDHPMLDLTIDGADEVDPRLNLLKGGGGAHLREKVLAAASRRLLIVVEAEKLVPRLGTRRGVPLEILPFAAGYCRCCLAELDGRPALRRMAAGQPVVTDNGNWVIDCAFPAAQMADPARLDQTLSAITGVLATGIFWTFRPTVFVGDESGVRALGPL